MIQLSYSDLKVSTIFENYMNEISRIKRRRKKGVLSVVCKSRKSFRKFVKKGRVRERREGRGEEGGLGKGGRVRERREGKGEEGGQGKGGRAEERRQEGGKGNRIMFW